MYSKSKGKMTSGEGTEEERGGEGSALLCLSSPPNATHVRGLGNNESPSQWDRRHYRAHAASLCERQLCCRLSFSCQPLPCDTVTFRSFPSPCCVWGSITLGLIRSRWTVARVPHRRKRTNTSISIITGYAPQEPGLHHLGCRQRLDRACVFVR